MSPKVEHSYYSRISYQEVFDKMNITLNQDTDIHIIWQEFINAGSCDKPKKIRFFIDSVMSQQNIMLGHIVTAGPLDPMKQPTINDHLQIPNQFTDRVGRPRLNWVRENCK